MSHSESSTASVAMTRTIAFLVYDLRASGVVRNILCIDEAAREAGLDARLWPVRHQGDDETCAIARRAGTILRAEARQGIHWH
jgi:hypothetical protein